MTIYPQRILPEETLTLEEELPATVLQLDEALVRQRDPIQVNLAINRDGEELLVTGSIATVLDICCGRCADWMVWPVNIPNFILLLEPPFNDTIDLTPFIREDILLDLPVAASCRLDEDRRCPLSGKIYPESSEVPPNIGQDAWKALDKLKVREEE